MFLSFALLLFLLGTSAVAAPVHEDVTLTRREEHQTLAELAGELHGAIFVRDDLPYRKVNGFVTQFYKVSSYAISSRLKQASQGSLVDWPVHIPTFNRRSETSSHASTGRRRQI